MFIDDSLIQTTSDLVQKAYTDGVKDGIKFATEQLALKIEKRNLSDDDYVVVQGKNLTKDDASIITNVLKLVFNTNNIIVFMTDDINYKIDSLNKMLENLSREKEVVDKTERNVNPLELHKFRILEDNKHE